MPRCEIYWNGDAAKPRRRTGSDRAEARVVLISIDLPACGHRNDWIFHQLHAFPEGLSQFLGLLWVLPVFIRKQIRAIVERRRTDDILACRAWRLEHGRAQADLAAVAFYEERIARLERASGAG